MDHMNPHLVVFNLQQGLLYSLDRALNIGLDNHIKGLQLAGLQGVKQGVQRHLMEGVEFFFLGSFLTLLHQLAGQPLIGYGIKAIAAHRRTVQAHNLHRHTGSGRIHLTTAIIGHGAHLTHCHTGYNHIAGMERTVLHK